MKTVSKLGPLNLKLRVLTQRDLSSNENIIFRWVSKIMGTHHANIIFHGSFLSLSLVPLLSHKVNKSWTPNSNHKSMDNTTLQNALRHNDISPIRYTGVMWLLFLSRTSRSYWYMIQRGSTSKHHKQDTHFKETRLHPQVLITTLHPTMNTTGRGHTHFQ